jgi:hypothetical protein
MVSRYDENELLGGDSALDRGERWQVEDARGGYRLQITVGGSYWVESGSIYGGSTGSCWYHGQQEFEGLLISFTSHVMMLTD